MAFEIKILILEDQPTLVMKTVTPAKKLPEFFGKAFGGVMAYLAELGEQPVGMPFGAYFNLDMSALEMSAGFPVGKSLPGKGEIVHEVIPGGKFLSTVFEGPYNAMEPVYTALNEYAKQNGFELTGVAYEYYLNDPTEGENVIPITEIRFPLK